MNFSPSIFWDVDPKTLDLEKHKYYIIPRVVDYGTLEDVNNLFSYYGSERILEVLLKVPYLDKKTISYFALKFNIPREEFRAYRRQKEWKTWK